VLYTDLLGTLEVEVTVYTQAAVLQHNSVINTSALYFDE